MSKEVRTTSHQGQVVTFKSTREVALDAALRLPNARSVSGYDEKSWAEILVAEAAIIEKFLDRDGDASSEDEDSIPSYTIENRIKEFSKSPNYAKVADLQSINVLYDAYRSWSTEYGYVAVGFDLFQAAIQKHSPKY